jgi:hypothetical protein
MLKQLGVEVLERFLERVRLGTRNGALDDHRLNPGSSTLSLKEVHGIAEPASIVTSECPKESYRRTSFFGLLIWILMDSDFDLVLSFQFRDDVLDELWRFEKLDQRRRSS